MATPARFASRTLPSLRHSPRQKPSCRRVSIAPAGPSSAAPFSHSHANRARRNTRDDLPSLMSKQDLLPNPGKARGELGISNLTPEEQEQFNLLAASAPPSRPNPNDKIELSRGPGGVFRYYPSKRGFWAEDEEDPDAQLEDDDDHFGDDAITSMGHAQLEEHRDIREFMRIAAWEMPLLSKLAKPFELPSQDQPLRFRYTTYLGETHPAETKVVLEFTTADLVPKHIPEERRSTLQKLVGPRYNPDTDIVKMSCEKFSTRAQNKRYLGDLVDKLIKQAKHGDSFADVPLDLRHHKPKPKYVFPEEWLMTEQRQRQLNAQREETKLIAEIQPLVDGNAVVAEAARINPTLSTSTDPRLQAGREAVAIRAGRAGGRPNMRMKMRR